MGPDRGSDDVIALTRLINRKDGNCSKSSIPWATVEKMGEYYSDLKATIYNPRMVQFLEPVLNDELYSIICTFENDKENDVVKCVILKLTKNGQAIDSIPAVSWQVTGPDSDVNNFVFSSNANNRIAWSSFNITNVLPSVNSNQDTLKTSLIIEQDSSIGIKLESNGNIFTHKFDSPVSKSLF